MVYVSACGLKRCIYPVVLFDLDENLNKLPAHDLAFLPKHLAMRIIKPVFLSHSVIEELSYRRTRRFIKKSVVKDVEDTYIVTRCLPIIDISELRDYTASVDLAENFEKHAAYAIWDDYLVVTRFKIRGALKPGHFAPLKHVSPGTTVHLGDLGIYVNSHVSGLENLVRCVYRVLSVLSPIVREYVTVFFYARNGLFFSAYEPLPRFQAKSDTTYTISHVFSNKSTLLSVIIDWDNDVFNEHVTNLNIFDLSYIYFFEGPSI